MDRKIYLFASLTLGLLVASCQNGLEEVINESAAQNELATTRSEGEGFGNEQNTAIIRPMTMSEDEAIKNVMRYNQGPSILGNYLIGGIEENQYYINSIPNNTDSIVWSYNTSQFTKVNSAMNSITLKLTNPTSTSDATIIAYFYRNGSIFAASYKNLGVNGPRINDGSVLVLGSSDGVQYYPNGYLEANTWYYAYYSGSYFVQITNWVFSDAQNVTFNGYQCHFQTTDAGGTMLAIWGKMPSYNVVKKLIDITLVGY